MLTFCSTHFAFTSGTDIRKTAVFSFDEKKILKTLTWNKECRLHGFYYPFLFVSYDEQYRNIRAVSVLDENISIETPFHQMPERLLISEDTVHTIFFLIFRSFTLMLLK
jgi:hypothetical protein